jgi:hypothetical protein
MGKHREIPVHGGKIRTTRAMVTQFETLKVPYNTPDNQGGH